MNARLLIVEDDLDLLGALERTFRALGYEVVSARTGSDALNKARLAKPDLVILDVMLPDMSGFEVCRRLRNEYQQARLPILILSALGQVQDKIKGLEMGADDYVTKPFDLGELQARVRARLESARRIAVTPAAPRGYVVGFLGAKGGVGTTVTATNVAGALVLRGEQVIIADLQPWPGAMALCLGLEQGGGQSQLLTLPPSDITPERVSAALALYGRGLRAMLLPQQPQVFDDLAPDRVEALIRSCASLARYVVVDVPRPPSPIARPALACCDLVAIVVEPLSFCVRLARRTLELVRGWIARDTVVQAVIVHRLPWATPLAAEAVSRALGCTLLGVVPPHADLSVNAIDSGRLLISMSPESIAADALGKLANSIAAAGAQQGTSSQ